MSSKSALRKRVLPKWFLTTPRDIQLTISLHAADIFPTYNILPKIITKYKINWETIPETLDPASYLPFPRCLRKREQLQNLVHSVQNVITQMKSNSSDNVRKFDVVDMCGGSGHSALLVAFLFPDVHVTLVDRNPTHVHVALNRLKELKLVNVSVKASDIQSFTGKCDLVIALHACGWLSDYIHWFALQKAAAYVIAPCCTGKTFQKPSTASFTYPRSQQMRTVLSQAEYFELCSFADWTSWNCSSSTALLRKYCSSMVQWDRNECARSIGYTVNLYQMIPSDCTPKNEMIVGFPTSIVCT